MLLQVSLPASGSLAVLRIKGADKLFLNQALCILKDNNPEVRRPLYEQPPKVHGDMMGGT